MSYAFVQDLAVSWRDYQQVAAALFEPAPTGLILHTAGPTDEGVRIIAIWYDEPAWRRFRAETLEPAIASLAGPAWPQPTFRDLHPAQLVGSNEACGIAPNPSTGRRASIRRLAHRPSWDRLRHANALENLLRESALWTALWTGLLHFDDADVARNERRQS